MRTPSKLVLLAGTLALFACGSDTVAADGDGSGSGSGSGSTATGTGTAGLNVCGDGVPAPGQFCFELGPVAAGIEPSTTVAVGDYIPGGWLEVSSWTRRGETDELLLIDYEMTPAATILLSGVYETAAPVTIDTAASASAQGLALPTLADGPLDLFVPQDSEGLTHVVGPEDPHYPGFRIDIEQDGVSEILMGVATNNDVDAPGAYVWRWNGEAYASDSVEYELPGCGVLHSADVGDLDDDGFLDIVAVSRYNYACAPPGAGIEPGSDEVVDEFHQLAILRYSPAQDSYAVSMFSPGMIPSDATLLQLDGDGVLDLVVRGLDTRSRLTTTAWFGNGDGSFSFAQDLGISSPSLPIQADADQHSELVTARDGNDELVIIDDLLGERVAVVIGEAVRPLNVADIDRDGFDDVLTLIRTPEGEFSHANAIYWSRP